MSTNKIAIIGGSGLDDPQILKNVAEVNMETPYGKTSSPLLSGEIAGASVVVLARHGQKHTITPTNVPFRANIWALREIGCTHIIATTACGSLKEKIMPGDLIFLDQFIDFTKHRHLTFFDDEVIHTPMADPFCHKLRNLMIATASELNLSHHQTGTMLTIEGPRFSTRAESKYFAQIGADVINMSTVPEVILARELGICYASVAMATDYDSWKENAEAVTWEKILQVMAKNADNVKRLLTAVVPKINFSQCKQCQRN
jgi:5'-methylthioadenosine phosphorylase